MEKFVKQFIVKWFFCDDWGRNLEVDEDGAKGKAKQLLEQAKQKVEKLIEK